MRGLAPVRFLVGLVGGCCQLLPAPGLDAHQVQHAAAALGAMPDRVSALQTLQADQADCCAALGALQMVSEPLHGIAEAAILLSCTKAIHLWHLHAYTTMLHHVVTTGCSLALG